MTLKPSHQSPGSETQQRKRDVEPRRLGESRLRLRSLLKHRLGDDVFHHFDGTASKPCLTRIDEGAGNRVVEHVTPTTEEL